MPGLGWKEAAIAGEAVPVFSLKEGARQLSATLENPGTRNPYPIKAKNHPSVPSFMTDSSEVDRARCHSEADHAPIATVGSSKVPESD